MDSRPYTVIEYETTLAQLSDQELDEEAQRVVQINDQNIIWKVPLLHTEYSKRKKVAPIKMSVIFGSGYGDSHEWETPYDLQIWWKNIDGILINPVGGPTGYRCRLCRATFEHYYHVIRDIFEAIEKAGIVDVCPQLGGMQWMKT